MLLLTDRVADAKRIQHVLQQLRPCTIAAIHHAPVLPAVFSTLICDVRLDSAASLEVTKLALARHRTRPGMPVVFLLRDPSHLTREQARLAGATATLDYPMADDQLATAVAALLQRRSPATADESAAQKTTAAAEDTVATLANVFGASVRRRSIDVGQVEKGADVLIGVLRQVKIRTWLDVVWSYDDATYQHCLLVAGLSAAFGIELGLPPQSQQLLVRAALLHDVGKAHIPHEILNKPGKLTDAEMTVMRTHAAIGFEMLRRQPHINPIILSVARHHHEMLDGTGYPDRLRSEQISRPVRMLTICDIYAALVERRSYKEPFPPKAALAQLEAMGDKLDRPLLQAFRNVVEDRAPVLAAAQ